MFTVKATQEQSDQSEQGEQEVVTVVQAKPLEPELSASRTRILSVNIRAKYRILQVIGEGSYGLVFRAEKRDDPERTKQQYAIKLIKPHDTTVGIIMGEQNGELSSDAMMGLSAGNMSELSLLARLTHPNIIRMEEAMYDASQHTLEMVLELADTDLRGQIRAWWRASNTASQQQQQQQHMIRVAYDIFCGLNYLHQNGILHLDIKPENVLLLHGRAKLADFGLSEREDGSREEGHGKVTWQYRSPELQCKLGRYDVSADIWSVGVVLMKMFFGRNAIAEHALSYDDLAVADPTLFYAITQVVGKPSAKLMKAYAQASHGRCIARGGYNDDENTAARYLNLETTLLTPADVVAFKKFYKPDRYQAILDLIHACLRFDPRERITFRDIQQHPLFAKGDGCVECACETVRGFHMPDNAHHLLPASVERLVRDIEKTPALIRYSRELFKRVELSQPVRSNDVRNEMACACVSIASKLLNVHDIARLHRELMLHVARTTLEEVNQLDSVHRSRKWTELAASLHRLEGVCGNLVAWNFDGPWHATGSTNDGEMIQEHTRIDDERSHLISMFHAERKHIMDATYMNKAHQPELNAKMREVLIDWLVDIHADAELSQRTLFLAVQVLDRYLAKHTVTQSKFQINGCAALMFASMHEDTKALKFKVMTRLADRTFSRRALIAEKDAYDAAGLDLAAPVIFDFMRPLARLGRIRVDTEAWCLAMYLAELSLQSYSMIAFVPSYIAAAAFYLTMRTMASPVKAASIAPLIYTMEELAPCIRKLDALFKLNQADNLKLTAIQHKYANPQLAAVSKLALTR
jgi:serine/threonine protein kinase